MMSQMRVIRTSGSVGAPGEQSPGATRPDAPIADILVVLDRDRHCRDR